MPNTPVPPLPDFDASGSVPRGDVYRDLVESLEERHFIYAHDIHGVFTYISPSVTRILGYTTEEFCKHYTTYYTAHPLNAEAVRRTDLAIRGLRQPPYEVEMYGKDGRARWLEVSEAPVFGPAGEVAGVQGIAHEITARKEIERALNESREELQESARRFREILENMRLFGVMLDCEGRVTFCNDDLLALTGWRREELLGRDWFGTFEPGPQVRAEFERGLRAGEIPSHSEGEIVTRSGERRFVIFDNVLLRDMGGSPTGTASIGRDVTEERRAARIQSALYRIAERASSARDLPELFRALHEIVGELMYARNFYIALHDTATGQLSFPYFVDEMDAVPPVQGLGRGLTAYVIRTEAPLLATVEKSMELAALGEAELVGAPSLFWLGVPLKTGDRIFGVLVVQSYREGVRYTSADEEVLTFVSQHIAAALERKRAEDAIRHQAFHDALTGLPNRLLFQDRLTQSLALSGRRRELVAVMYLDLDRFKTVNDTLGHGAGDRVLQGVAARLIGCLREGDTVARMGGDEFMLLLPAVRQASDVVKIAEQLLAALRPAFHVDGHELHVTTSIGVSLYPADGNDAETLVKHADIAMYRAKERGRDCYELFGASLAVQGDPGPSLEVRLRRALEREEFVLYFQPQVDVTTGAVPAVEVLVRWKNPEGRLVAPADFVPVCESAGLILPLGEWILQAACAQVRAWEQDGIAPVEVSVNLSARQVEDPDLARVVARTLVRTGLPASRLGLELRESMLLRGAETASATLRELRDLGVGLTVDDVGRTSPSLAHLRRFAIQWLKIDAAFLGEAFAAAGVEADLDAVLSTARSLGWSVAAKGVETPEQLAFVRRKGCGRAQGFLLGRPAAAYEIAAILRGGIPRQNLG